MKNIFFLLLFLPLFANAETGKIYLTLTSAVKLTEAKALAFGSVVTTGEATVTVTPTGTRTSTGECTLPDMVCSEGAFGVLGAPNSPFIVSFGAASATNGKSTLVIDGFKTNLVSNTGTTDATGKALFSVGATVHIGLLNSSGNYVGSYIVNAIYQ